MPNAIIGAINGALDRSFTRLIQVLNLHMGFLKDKSMEWFQYHMNFDFAANWAAGAEQTSSVNITQEAHFVCYEISAACRMLIGASGNLTSRVGQVITYPRGNNNAGGVGAAATYGEQSNVCGSFELLLTDGSSDRQRQDNFVESAAAIGPASHPTRVSKPWLLRANSNISGRVRPTFGALEAAESLRISLIFNGYKIYKKEMLDLTRHR